MRPSLKISLKGLEQALSYYFFGGWMFKIVWNSFIPALFGLPALLYWNAVGIIALAQMLHTPKVSTLFADSIRELDAKEDLKDLDEDYLDSKKQ